MVDHLVFRDTKLAGCSTCKHRHVRSRQDLGRRAAVRLRRGCRCALCFYRTVIESTLQMIFSAFLITFVLSFKLTVACSVFVLVLFSVRMQVSTKKVLGAEKCYSQVGCATSRPRGLYPQVSCTLREITLLDGLEKNFFSKAASWSRLSGPLWPWQKYMRQFPPRPPCGVRFQRVPLHTCGDTGNAKSFVDEHGSVA